MSKKKFPKVGDRIRKNEIRKGKHYGQVVDIVGSYRPHDPKIFVRRYAKEQYGVVEPFYAYWMGDGVSRVGYRSTYDCGWGKVEVDKSHESAWRKKTNKEIYDLRQERETAKRHKSETWKHYKKYKPD